MISLLLAASALAQDVAPERQFRRIQLTDGRVLDAEILSTTPEGMSVATPQGRLLISYELLLDMSQTDKAGYEAQDPWVVLVAAPKDAPITRMLDAIPGLVVWSDGGTVGEPAGPLGLAPAEEAALRTCGVDPACLDGSLGQSAGWKWLVKPDPTDATVWLGEVTSGDTRTLGRVASTSDQAVWAAAHAVLGLSAPLAPPPISLAPPRARAAGPGLVFAPVPGMPALANGQGGRFALALGVAVPATALWLGAVGTHAESVPEEIGLGAVGFYAITVLTNELIAGGDARRR